MAQPMMSERMEPLFNPDPKFVARVRRSMAEHRDVLNRLEPHLGCVVCRGPLTDGRCEACNAE